MATYTVQDTTMQALGDAVRSKVIGTTEQPISTISEQYISYNKAYSFEFPTYVKKIKIVGTGRYTMVWDGNANGYQGVGIAPGIYINEHETRRAEGYIVAYTFDMDTIYDEKYFDFEAMVEGNSFTLVASIASSNSTSYYLTYTAIGLDENGNEFKYTPAEMVDEINGLNLNPTHILPKIISRVGRPYYSITKEDLGDITKIGSNAFFNAGGLNSIELPDTVRSIEDNGIYNTSIREITLPAALNKLGSSAFGSCSILTTVRILNDTSVITCPTASYSNPFYNCNGLKVIYIPSKLYNDYCADICWGQYQHLFVPVGEWVFDKNLSTYFEYSNEKEYSISLSNFTSTPDFSITLDKNEYAEITDIFINDDNTEITFKVKALNSDGVEALTVTIYGEEQTFTLTGTITVMETIPESTYEVVAVDGAQYGFALNDNGYYESQNKGKSSTYALCQVNISNPIGMPIYFDCVSYGESNYDYGIVGSVNQTLSKSTTDDSGVKKNFKGLSSTNIQTVEYTDASGDCFIQIKYKKDGSGDQGNDTLQFKIRFE